MGEGIWGFIFAFAAGIGGCYMFMKQTLPEIIFSKQEEQFYEDYLEIIEEILEYKKEEN